MQHDAWFFVGIFVVIFFVWLLIGGPARPISWSGPTLSPPQELGGGTYLSLPRAPFGLGGTNISLPGSSDGGGYVGGSSYNQQTPSLTGVAFGTPSPYRGIVRLSHYVSSPASQNETIELFVSQSANVPVTISGWTLKSETTGKIVTIPQGTEIPTTGTINATQDIVIAPGKSATLITGRSPLGGSFRENKCIGYYSSFQKFTPPLPQSCPLPSDELERFYGPGYASDTYCIEYVKKLPRCQVNLTPPPNASNACSTFMTNRLHYNGCVEVHRNDADFLGDTWRVYLGRTEPLWRTRYEVVKLIDKEGKTVDAFAY